VLAITDESTGATSELRYSYGGSQGAIRGFGTVRIPFGRITVTHAGTYRVRASGLDSATDYSRWGVVLSRPYLARMAVQIMAIVLSGVAALLCLILGAWQIFPPQGTR